MVVRLKLIQTRKSNPSEWVIWERSEADAKNWLEHEVNLYDEITRLMKQTKGKKSTRRKVPIKCVIQSLNALCSLVHQGKLQTPVRSQPQRGFQGCHYCNWRFEVFQQLQVNNQKNTALWQTAAYLGAAHDNAKRLVIMALTQLFYSGFT